MLFVLLRLNLEKISFEIRNKKTQTGFGYRLSLYVSGLFGKKPENVLLSYMLASDKTNHANNNIKNANGKQTIVHCTNVISVRRLGKCIGFFSVSNCYCYWYCRTLYIACIFRWSNGVDTSCLYDWIAKNNVVPNIAIAHNVNPCMLWVSHKIIIQAKINKYFCSRFVMLPNSWRFWATWKCFIKLYVSQWTSFFCSGGHSHSNYFWSIGNGSTERQWLLADQERNFIINVVFHIAPF